MGDSHTVSWVFSETAAQDHADLWVYVCPDLGHGPPDFVFEFGHLPGYEGQLTVDQFEQHHSQGPHVHSIVVEAK